MNGFLVEAHFRGEDEAAVGWLIPETKRRYPQSTFAMEF